MSKLLEDEEVTDIHRLKAYSRTEQTYSSQTIPLHFHRRDQART